MGGLIAGYIGENYGAIWHEQDGPMQTVLTIYSIFAMHLFCH